MEGKTILAIYAPISCAKYWSNRNNHVFCINSWASKPAKSSIAGKKARNEFGIQMKIKIQAIKLL